MAARRSGGRNKPPPPSGLIDIQILGDSRDVAARLEGMERAFSNERIAAWMVAGLDPLLRRRTAERFESEGDDISGKWESLRPNTVARRKADHFPGEHPINVRTGAMKRHLLDDMPRIAIHTLGATMWSPGSDGGSETASKVKTAQAGGTTPEGRPVPARPVLGVGPVDLEAALISLSIHIASNQPGAMPSGGFQ